MPISLPLLQPHHRLSTAVSDQLFRQKLQSRNSSQRFRDGQDLAPASHCQESPGILGLGAQLGVDSPLPRSAYASLLRFCGINKRVVEGKTVYDRMVRGGHDSDPFLSNLVLQMYCESGSMRDARKVFGLQPKHDVFSWNFMIKACSRYGLGKESLQLFKKMHREAMLPDLFVFATLISACANDKALVEGKRLHACAILAHSGSEESVVATALISLYGKCGLPVEARNVFDKMQKRDVVAWTAIIDAYLRLEDVENALERYVAMQGDGIMPDRYIIINILEACANRAKANEGKKMHSFIRGSSFEKDAVVGNALINMYGKCKNVDDALNVFMSIPAKDVVSWNAMIAAYAENECVNQALDLFDDMRAKEVKPEETTYASVFSICADFGAIERGKEIHRSICESVLASDNGVGTSIIDMYGLCGCMPDAIDLFQKLPADRVSSWDALLAAHARAGDGVDSISVFQEMLSAGVFPNKDTYTSLLSACGVAGLIDESYGYFESMGRDYGISPAIEHYNCLIYMLGRVRRLSEAVNLIGKMPMEPNTATWLTLLAACRNCVDIRRGERIAKHLFQLEPHHPAPYSMLRELYLADNRDADALRIKVMMEGNEVVQEAPGRSSIEVNRVIHIFCDDGDDRSHSQKDEIYSKLANLCKMMRQEEKEEEEVSEVQDASDSEYQSETIAAVFGVINACPGARIFVVKNSRICSQSHSRLKFMSQYFGREIVVRDAGCLHVMKGGGCSCADYW